MVPSASAPQSRLAAPAVHTEGERQDGCGWWSCWAPELITPLAYNGTTFSVVPVRNCDGFDLLDAKPYTAPTSGPLALSGPVNLTPTCASNNDNRDTRKPDWGWNWPTPPPRSLYIFGIQISGYDCHGVKHDGSRAHSSVRHPRDGDDWPIAIVAGPVDPNASSWSFPAFSPGLTMKAKAQYVFYVVSLPTIAGSQPAPTPTPVVTPVPAPFTVLAPVNYDGVSTFSISKVTCGSVTSSSGTPYTATANGAFATPLSISLTPTCSPGGGQLYLIAIVAGGSSTTTPSGWIVANLPDASVSPWVFSSAGDTFLTQAGVQYEFFVGTLTGGK
jgi:hypothetical protein